MNFGRSFLEDNFSIFHLNIRSVSKGFEKFKDFWYRHTNSFKVIVLSETWLKDENANKNSLHQIPNYTPIHLTRNGSHKGGSVDLFVHNSLNCKEKRDVSKSNNIETLSVEIINKNKKNLDCVWYLKSTTQWWKNEYKSLIKTDFWNTTFCDLWYQYKFTWLWI